MSRWVPILPVKFQGSNNSRNLSGTARRESTGYWLAIRYPQAARLDICSVTADQYMNLTIFHELPHNNGAIGNPDKSPDAEESYGPTA